MIFRQLFDTTSSTYTYLIASRRGGEALILDPVLERVDRYIKLLEELQLRLVKAVDTHVHADHVTGLGELRDRTRCITVMGEQTGVDVVSMRVADGEKVGRWMKTYVRVVASQGIMQVAMIVIMARFGSGL